MCGITGVISLNGSPININKIKSMCDAIQHRGPDGAGYWVCQTGIHHKRQQQYSQLFTEKKFAHQLSLIPSIDEEQSKHYLHQHHWDVFFGHRRLAILDLSASGFQPMSDLSKNVWVTYNGEIYNFREIRETLIKLGYEFYSNTDTEVLINAYVEWGIECIYKFNGMFAFALLDKQQKRCFLVRDRYGIKPLYYKRTSENQLVFGSEIKSILPYLTEKPQLDYEGLAEYFTFQNFFTPKTLFSDIQILPAGHFLEIDLNKDSKTILKEYWDFDFNDPSQDKHEKDYIEELNFLFEQAVNRQLVSDVELGSYLSGGIDSGAITCLTAQKLPYVKTFTVGFDLTHASGIELGFDEREKAELLSYLYRTEHYEMVLKSGDMERCLPSFAWHLEEPRVGQSYPNYYAAKLASKFVKVVLSGSGGDELFGGYPWRYYHTATYNDYNNYIDNYYQFWQRLVPNSELKLLFSPIWDRISHVWTRDIFESVLKKHKSQLQKPEDYLNRSLYFEAKTFLHGLLVVEDKLSMSQSLEARVPFLDNDLVDFAQKIPARLKIKNFSENRRIDENSIGKQASYFKKTSEGKSILRTALKKYMPIEYTDALKQGFSAPDNTWFRMNSNNFIQRTLLNQDAKIYNLFNYDYVSQKLEDHIREKSNNRLFIWSLINLEFYLNRFQ